MSASARTKKYCAGGPNEHRNNQADKRTPTGAAPGSPAGHKRAAEGGQVADGNAKSPARRGSNTGKTAARSSEASPRQMLPPDASELGDSVGTTPARDDAARTAQVGAADEGVAEDSLQGTELLSMMNEIGEEELELETELELEAQQRQQPQSPPSQQPPSQQQQQQQEEVPPPATEKKTAKKKKKKSGFLRKLNKGRK